MGSGRHRFARVTSEPLGVPDVSEEQAGAAEGLARVHGISELAACHLLFGKLLALLNLMHRFAPLAELRQHPGGISSRGGNVMLHIGRPGQRETALET